MGHSSHDLEASTIKSQESLKVDENEVLHIENVEEEKISPRKGLFTPREEISLWRWWLTLAGLYMGSYLYGLDMTIAASIRSPAYASLGQIEKFAWVGIAFPLSSASCLFFFARLYQLFNVRWLTFGFVLAFGVGSAVCGSAPNMDALIIGRALAGAGGCGIYLGALTYITAYGQPREIPLYNALISLFWAVGAISGPVIGGAFSESHATWRWAFFINLPLMAIFAPVFLWCVPDHRFQPHMSLYKKFRVIDWLGSFLHAGTFTTFLVGVTFSGSAYAWSSTFTLAVWIVWAVLFVGYVLQQKFSILTTPQWRIYPAELLKSKTMLLLHAGTGCSACAHFISLYYIPLFFQYTHGDSALQSATRLLPLICAYIFTAVLTGALLSRLRIYAMLYLISGTLILIGGCLMFTVDINTPVSRIYGYEAIQSAGAGMIFQTGIAIGIARAPAELKQKVAAFMLLSQLGSLGVSLAIAGCLFQNLGFSAMQHALLGYGVKEKTMKMLLGGWQSGAVMQLSPEVASIARIAITETISKIYWIVIAAGASLVVLSLFMRWEKLEFPRPGEQKLSEPIE